jgi:2-polyprenyl-3-methyl-5-hydroxy-6-metoxy-1,4-benzoquinol methylase
MPNSHENNGRTVAAYEGYARRYAEVVSPEPSESAAATLRRFAEMLPAGGRVLDIGSGPGWDADFLETLGVRVHRTDVTAEFRTLQAERGHQVDALDVLTDEIAETYDGILMLAVLQHFERTDVDAVLRKLVNALNENGALLLSHPVGEDEFWEGSTGAYRVVRWSGAMLDDRLQRAGLTVLWDKCEEPGDHGVWRSVLARKAA